MRVSPSLVATPLYWLHRLFCATLRFREENRQPLDELNAKGEKLIFCLWHDELFPLRSIKKQLNLLAVVSPSRDGDLLAHILRKQGLYTVRGSSSRGGASALLGAAKLMKSTHVHACVTVDGPRGPRHKAKKGALFLAAHTDAYVAPLRIIMHKSFCLGSWDRFQLPLPFSRVVIRHGTPWKVETQHGNEVSDEVLAQAKLRLEENLAELAPERPEAPIGQDINRGKEKSV